MSWNQSDKNSRQDSGWGNHQSYNNNQSNSSWGPWGHSHNGSGRGRNRQQSYDNGNQQSWGSNRFHGHDRTHHDRQFTSYVPTSNSVPQMNQQIPKKPQQQNKQTPKKQQQHYYGQEKKMSRDDTMPVQSQAEKNGSSNAPMEISKDFFEMTWEEKINSQFPKYDNQLDKSRTFQDIPAEYQVEDDEYWKSKKKIAAEVAAKKAIAFYRQKTSPQDPEDDEYHSGSSLEQSDDDGYESSDDGAGYGGLKKNRKRNVPNPDIGPEEIDIFFDALQHNVLFDMGWRVNGFSKDDTKNCWCPCSRHMEPWLVQFKLTSIAGKDSEAFCNTGKGSKRFEPIGLMGHIESMGHTSISSQVLHYGIKVYLQSVYGDLYGDIGHKCLYKMGDENYKKAEAYERKSKNKMIMDLKRLNDEANRKLEALKREKEEHEERLKKMAQVNEDLSKQIEKLENDKELLKVKGKKESKEISEKDKTRNNKLRVAFFNNLHACKTTKPPVVIQVPAQNFNLHKFFLHHVGKGDEFTDANDKTYLFRDLKYNDDKHYHAPKLIFDWKIQFENFATTGKRIKKDKAEDEGGPTREFFSQVWRQLGSLKVSVPTSNGERKRVKLFERCPAGVIPNTDVNFEIRGNVDATSMLRKKAKIYYRAIGRIMFRSLVTNHAISSEAMPTFFRNVIFRNCGPEERNKEHREDILDELHEIGLTYDFKDCFGLTVGLILGIDDDEIITEETIFTKILPGFSVKSRELAIEAMKEGLTLNGAVDVLSLFRMMPSPVVSSLVFSKPTVEWADLKRVLSPTYSDPYGSITQENQKYFFESIFLQVLEDRAVTPEVKEDAGSDSKKNFLSTFVHFCTGLHYLPSKEADPDFSIQLEFSSELKEDYLPKAHTCTKELVVPKGAYNNDKELFEENLIKAIEYSQSSFGMR